MSKQEKKILDQILVDYAAKNEMKKKLAREIDDLNTEIKQAMTSEGIDAYQVDNVRATLTFRVSKRLNLAKVEALLGKKIPEECYDLWEVANLNVKVA